MDKRGKSGGGYDGMPLLCAWADLRRAFCLDTQIVQTAVKPGRTAFVGLFRAQDQRRLGLVPIEGSGLLKRTILSAYHSFRAPPLGMLGRHASTMCWAGLRRATGSMVVPKETP